jgi:ABC-type sugar transport system substrate-binding protein
MKKFKIIAIVLVLFMTVFMFAACKTETPAPAPEPAAPAPAEQAEPAPEPETPAEPTVSPELGIPLPKNDIRVVWTMFNGENPVAREIETGFLAAAKDIGPKLDLWVMDNKLDPVVMNANVDMAISAGDVDYFILYTNHIESNPQLMTKLTEAGIPVITQGTAAIADDGTEAPVFFTATDNYDSAFIAGEALGKAAVERGWTEDECVFLRMGFDEAGGVFLIRNEGAMAGIQSIFPNIEIIESSSTGSAEVAHQRTTDVLQTLPKDKKLLGWTHSDDVTGAMMAAAQTAGRDKDVLLASNGLNLSMLDMLRDPDTIIVGSIDLSFTQWGTTILTYVINYLNDGTPVPMEINAPIKLITPQNVNEYYPK